MLWRSEKSFGTCYATLEIISELVDVTGILLLLECCVTFGSNCVTIVILRCKK